MKWYAILHATPPLITGLNDEQSLIFRESSVQLHHRVSKWKFVLTRNLDKEG